MTVEAIMKQWPRVGLERIAITEHVFAPDDLERIALIANEIPSGVENVVLGAEMDADATALDGTLVAPTEGLDWVIASFHKFPGTSIWWHDEGFRELKEEKTIYGEWIDWVHRVIAVGRPDALGHLGAMICQLSIVKEFGGSILRDFTEIMQSCRKHGVAVELNEGMHRKITPAQKATYYRVFQLARQEKVKIVLGSDAHSLPQIGRYVWAREIVEKLGIEMSDCVFPAKKTNDYSVTFSQVKG
jgi:HisJ family histidinol phosphate phosphatase